MSYLGAITLALGGFFLTPFMIHTLGRQHYGVLALVTALMGYMSLMDLGLGTSVMKLIADAADDVDPTRVKRLMSSMYFLFVGIGLIAALILIPIFPLIKGDFHVPASDRAALRDCYVIGTLSVCLCFPQGVFSAAMQAHRRYGRLNQLVVCQALIATGGTFVILKLGFGIVAVALLQGGVTAAGFLARAVMAHVTLGVGVSIADVDTRVMREVAKFASWMFLINIAGMIIFETDPIVVGVLLGPVAVTAYQVALSPNVVLQGFAEQMSSVTITAASALRAAGDHAGVRRLFLESTLVATVFVVPFGICVAAWGGAFLRLWVGARFDGSHAALLWLTLATLVYGIQTAAAQIIVAHGRQARLGVALGIEAVCNLALSIVLGRAIGITGVALGTFIPTCITVMVVTLPYAARLTATSMTQVALRITVPIGEAVGLSVLLHELVPPRTFHSILTLAIAGGGVFVGFVALNLLVISHERDTYRRYLNARFMRQPPRLPEVVET